MVSLVAVIAMAVPGFSTRPAVSVSILRLALAVCVLLLRARRTFRSVFALNDGAVGNNLNNGVKSFQSDLVASAYAADKQRTLTAIGSALSGHARAASQTDRQAAGARRIDSWTTTNSSSSTQRA